MIQNTTLDAGSLALRWVQQRIEYFTVGSNGLPGPDGEPIPHFGDLLCLTIRRGSSGARFETDWGESHAFRRLRVSWFDEGGRSLAADDLTSDRQGRASCLVPRGAARWQLETRENPERPSRPSARPPQAQSQVAKIPTMPLASLASSVDSLRAFHVFGGPCAPRAGGDEPELHYGFLVFAKDSSEVPELIAPILREGVGAAVPDVVQVLRWTRVAPSPGGLLVVTAQPAPYEEWTLDLNDGAHRATLDHDSIRVRVGDWEVIEAELPIEELDTGDDPDFVYENEAFVTFRTKRMTHTRTTAYLLEYRVD